MEKEIQIPLEVKLKCAEWAAKFSRSTFMWEQSYDRILKKIQASVSESTSQSK